MGIWGEFGENPSRIFLPGAQIGGCNSLGIQESQTRVSKVGKGSKNPKQEQHPPHEDHNVVDLHLGQSAEKTGKDQGNWSVREKPEEFGGRVGLAAPAGIFHFGVNKTISQHLEKISGKGIEQEK